MKRHRITRSQTYSAVTRVHGSPVWTISVWMDQQVVIKGHCGASILIVRKILELGKNVFQ